MICVAVEKGKWEAGWSKASHALKACESRARHDFGAEAGPVVDRTMICRETGIHSSTVRYLFRNKLSRMDRPTRLRLCHFVGCDMDELFE